VHWLGVLSLLVYHLPFSAGGFIACVSLSGERVQPPVRASFALTLDVAVVEESRSKLIRAKIQQVSSSNEGPRGACGLGVDAWRYDCVLVRVHAGTRVAQLTSRVSRSAMCLWAQINVLVLQDPGEVDLDGEALHGLVEASGGFCEATPTLTYAHRTTHNTAGVGPLQCDAQGACLAEDMRAGLCGKNARGRGGRGNSVAGLVLIVLLSPQTRPMSVA
jgi:hypothetical protein